MLNLGVGPAGFGLSGGGGGGLCSYPIRQHSANTLISLIAVRRKMVSNLVSNQNTPASARAYPALLYMSLTHD